MDTTRDEIVRFTKFLWLSLAAHAALIIAFLLLQRFGFVRLVEVTMPTQENKIEVIPIAIDEVEKIRNQVAETELLKKSEKSAKDAFLGQQTQVVSKQSRAQEGSRFQQKILGGGGGKAAVQSNGASNGKLSLSGLGIKIDFSKMGATGPGQMATTNDYLKDVQQGAQTMLNTREFAYFSFYQRVRQQLEQFWEPGLRKRIADMFNRGRQIASEREHSTRLLVVLNEQGTITKILVEGTSGVYDLDQAAVDAFNKAGPFPNPPRGMMDADGTVKVEWEFVLRT